VDPRLRYFFYLIALGAGFGAGLFVFPSANDRPLVTGFDSPQSSRPIVRPSLGPIMAQGSDIVPIEAPAKSASEPPVPDSRPAVSPPREKVAAPPVPPARETELLKPESVEAQRFEPVKPEPPKVTAEKPAADKTAATKPEVPTAQAIKSEPPKSERRAPKRIVVERPAPSAENKVAEDPPARHKAARREAARKKAPSEALRTVRKFDDKLQDIPVSAYAADGARRNIVIRPTNIQDVYYYSVPR
jgi:hypothetical protein